MVDISDIQRNESRYYRAFLLFSSSNDNAIRERRPREWKSSVSCPETHIIGLSKLGFDISFREHKKDDKLIDYISGKRVCIVGPAPQLLGKNYGKKIDEYDIVVRIHDYGGLQNIEDYGTKSDIFISCMNIPSMKQMKDNRDHINSHKFVIASNVGLWNLEIRKKWFEENFDTNFINLHDGYIFNLANKIGTLGNTGFNALCALLKYDLSELHVTGFSFYMKDDDGKFYHEDHIETSAKVHLDIHNQEKQIKYFTEILEKDKRVTLGPFLEKWRKSEDSCDDTGKSRIEKSSK